jgi:predicted Ser/Thr protein kinase
VTVALASRHTHFGDFRLRAYRGGGGFSDVYEAEGPDGARVAIKVLRTGPTTGDERRRRFEREREILDSLDVRRISRLIQAELDAHPPWIASEYVDGPTLREAISERGPMTILEVQALVGQLARTLAELHAAGIAHRDLTPNNVLLGVAGPVIIDFGSAREDLAADAGSVLSVATPGFASPEALTKCTVGMPADVFALARLAEFALSGSEATGTGWPGLADGQLAALARCLAVDPGTRPMATDVAKVFAVGDLPARLRSAAYSPVRLRPLPRRVRPITAALLAATAALVGIVGTALVTRGTGALDYDDVVGAAGGVMAVDRAPVRTRAGWLSTIPAIDGWQAAYTRPIDLDRGAPVLALEAWSITWNAPGVLEISTEMLPSDVASEIAALDLSAGGDVGSDRLPSLMGRVLERARAFADLAVPRECELRVVDSARIVPDAIAPRVRLAAATRECRDAAGAPLTRALLVDVHPAQGAMVVASMSAGEEAPVVGELLDAIEISSEPIVADVSAGDVALVGPDIDPAALQISSTSRYLRRAVALPAGRALRLDVGAPLGARIAMVAVPASASDAVVGLGALEGLEARTTWWWDNPSDEDWTVIVELDERGGESALDVTLGLGDARGAVATLDDFAVGGSPPSVGTLADPNDVVFVLPRGSEMARAIDYQRVAGVALPIPADWVVSSESNTSGAIVLNANPVSPYLAFLEDDSPRFDVISEQLGELTESLLVEEWMFTDRLAGCAGAREWEIVVGVVRLWWKAFAGCSVRDASFDGSNERLHAQHAPLVKFGLSTRYDTDGDGRADYDLGVLRGEFVPETRADLEVWRAIVASVREQIEQVTVRERRRCVDVLGAAACG